MTTKTFSENVADPYTQNDELSFEDEEQDLEEDLPDLESNDAVGDDNNRWGRSAITEGLTTSQLLSLYNGIKQLAYRQYFSCFMEKARFGGFVRTVYSCRSHTNDTQSKARDLQFQKTFKKLRGTQSFQRWYVGHERILNDCFDMYLNDICTFEKWAKFAYRGTSRCNCYNIEYDGEDDRDIFEYDGMIDKRIACSNVVLKI